MVSKIVRICGLMLFFVLLAVECEAACTNNVKVVRANTLKQQPVAVVAETNGVFKNFGEAGKVFAGMLGNDGNWAEHAVSRGGSSLFMFNSVTYGDYDNVIGRSSTTISSNHAGTIMAYPTGDFIELFGFRYFDGPTRIKEGRVVGSKVQLSNPNMGRIDRVVAKRMVEAMVKSGCALSSSVGSRPCRIMSVKSSAMKRYGATKCKEVYDVKNGFVLFVLGDLVENKKDITYLPATPQDMWKKDRMKLKTIDSQKDKGSFIVGGHTTIYYPAGDDPSHYIDLYNKGIR